MKGRRTVRSFFKKVGHEFKELFPIWCFFFLAFSLLRLTQSVILSEFGFHVTTPSLVLLGSLIVAKAFLILDWFSFVERFNGRPLVFGVLWKTFIYYCGAFLIYCLEQFVEFTIRHHSPALAWDRISTAAGTPRFWLVQLWLLLLLFVFTAARETIRALGESRFMALWFGRNAHDD
jgi:hypothetical protein